MLLLLCSILMLTMFWALPAHAQRDFLAPEQDFRLTVIKQPNAQVRLIWQISKGYYHYRKQMRIGGDQAGSAQQIACPAGTLKTAETLGESEDYHDIVDVLVPAPDGRALTVGWQGFADASHCYQQQTERVNLADFAAMASSNTGVAAASVSRAELGAFSEDPALAERLSVIDRGACCRWPACNCCAPTSPQIMQMIRH